MIHNRLLLAAISLPLCAQVPQLQDVGDATDPAISLDGRMLAFASDRAGSKNLHLWVRSLGGGTLHQLTAGSQDDHEPSFSPDGRTLAYRSEANGGGIYVIPVAGGKPRLFAASGRRPRFSPDGRQIAYWVDANSQARVFVAKVSGGRPVPFSAGFQSAKNPVWSPDGKSLIVAGCKDASMASCDWWVSPASGGEAVATGAVRLLNQQHLDIQASPDLWLSSGNTILFAGKTGEQTRLWTLNLRSNPWRVDSPPRRLTAGENDERSPSAAADGRVLFARRTENIDIWTLPLHADAAEPQGSLTRVMTDSSIDQRPSLSRDGKRMAWETSRGGNFEVWVKDLVSGVERGITNGPLREHMPALSPDGSRLVYDAHDGEKVIVFESSFDGGDPVRIREENVGQGSFQWTEKEDAVLYFHREPPGTVGLMNLASKKRTVLLRHAKLNLSLADARLSPDGLWIAFPVPFAPHRSRLAVARVSGTAANEQDWIYLTPETFNASQPEWSPNGRWLYFLSDQTGRLAVWALRVSSGMKLEGTPKVILDFPNAGLSIAEMRPRDIGLSVARDKLALAAAKYSWTIWSVRP